MRVCVKMEEEILDFDVDPKSIFRNLKQMIEEETNIPFEHQQFHFPKPPMNSEYSYDCMSVRPYDDVKIEEIQKPEWMQVVTVEMSVRVPNEISIFVVTEGEHIQLRLTDEKTADYVKKTIEGMGRFEGNRLLTLDGHHPLLPHHTLYEQGVTNDANLQLIQPTLDHSDISIDVATLEGKLINLTMEAGSRISDVKQKIKNMEDIAQDQICLFFNDRPLEDCYTLADYNIRNDSKLRLLYFRGL